MAAEGCGPSYHDGQIQQWLRRIPGPAREPSTNSYHFTTWLFTTDMKSRVGNKRRSHRIEAELTG